jgi:hypothetical protein
MAEQKWRERDCGEISRSRPSRGGELRGAVAGCAARGRSRSRECEGMGLDPDRIGILGFSAGGHLSAALAAHVQRTHVSESRCGRRGELRAELHAC